MAETPILPATERFANHVGPAVRCRPAVSFPRSAAGLASLLVGVALAVIGVDVVLHGGSRVGIAVLFAGYAVGGLALAGSEPPPYRTAGAVAVVGAIPAVVAFLLLEFDDLSASHVTSTLAVSTVAWGALYVAGPTRGHGVVLGATLLGAWATVLSGLDAPAVLDPDLFGVRGDLYPAAFASLAIGTLYAFAGWAIDRAGLQGTATGFFGGSIVALAAGAWLSDADAQPEVVVGTTLVLAGVVLGWAGRPGSRRATTGAAATGLVAGLGLLASATYDGDVTGPAVAVAVVGGIIVAISPRLGSVLNRLGAPSESAEPAAPDNPPTP